MAAGLEAQVKGAGRLARATVNGIWAGIDRVMVALRAPGHERYPGVAAIVIVLVAAYVVLNQIDAVLAGMRLPGVEGGGVDAAVTGDMQRVVEAWQGWHEGSTVFVSPGLMVSIYVAVDTIFVAAYATVLAFLLWQRRRRIRPPWAAAAGSVTTEHARLVKQVMRERQEIERLNRGRAEREKLRTLPIPPKPEPARIVGYASSWAGALEWVALVLVLGAVFDLAENLLLLAGYFSEWWLLGAVSTWAFRVKWLAIGFVLLSLAYFVLAARPAACRLEGRKFDDTLRAWVRGLTAMRVPLLAFVFVAVALGFGVVDQIPDAIRRWNPVTLLASVYFVLGLALGLWLFGWYIYDRVARRALRQEDPNGRVRRRVAVTIVLVAAAQVGAWALSGRRVGIALLIPAAMVALFAITERLLPAPEPDAGPREGWPRRYVPQALPRFFAAGVVASLGMATIAAGVPNLVIVRREGDELLVPLVIATAVVLVAAGFVVRALRRPPNAEVAPDDLGCEVPAGGADATELGPQGPADERVFWLGLATLLGPPLLLVGTWALGLDDDLRAVGAVSTGWLLGTGAVLMASAWSVYYFLDSGYFPLRKTGLTTGESHFDAFKRLFFGERREIVWRLGRRTLLVGVAVLTNLFMIVWLVWTPLRAAPVVGTIAIGSIWLTAVAVLALVATLFAERTEPPRLLRHLGLARTPVFLLAIVWIALAQLGFFRYSDFHNVRVAPDDRLTEPVVAALPEDRDQIRGVCPAEELPAPRERITIQYEFCRWLAANDLLTAEAEGPTPLVIVSAWGGGIRAAAWTAIVMDCLFEPDGYVVVTAELDGESVDLCARGPAEADPFAYSDPLFAVSGISGGSLGFAEYAAFLTAKSAQWTVEDGAWLPPGEGDEFITRPGDRWVQRLLGEDFLSPTVSQLLFVDMPLSLVGYVAGPADRAGVMERAWERPWRPVADGRPDSLLRQGLFRTWEENRHVPLLILNGTSHTDDCRFNASVLDAGVEVVQFADLDGDGEIDDPFVFDDCTSLSAFETGYPALMEETLRELPTSVSPSEWALVQSRDLADFLCPDRDVRLSTAALFSARFPAVSPPGRIERCEDEGVEEVAYVTDGGNLELSGTLTAAQVWRALEPLVDRYNARRPQACVVPFMIHLENGYAPPDAQELNPALPNEWLAPAQYSARDGLVKNARLSAALPFAVGRGGGGTVRVDKDASETLEAAEQEEPYSIDRYAFITTRAHPGVQAPFGWSLSTAAIRDLENQLRQNGPQLAEIRSWFDGSLTCQG